MSRDILRDLVNVSQNIVVGIADHVQPSAFQKFGSLKIVIDLVVVAATVEFHHKRGLRTEEIDHIQADYMLPAKFQPGHLRISEPTPEQPFRECRIRTELSGPVGPNWRDTMVFSSFHPLTLPRPLPGREGS